MKKDPETEMNGQKEGKNSGKASSGTKRSRRKDGKTISEDRDVYKRQVLMKPYLIDEVVNDNGDSVKKTEPVAYKRLKMCIRDRTGSS